jgi:hypothetical protein
MPAPPVFAPAPAPAPVSAAPFTDGKGWLRLQYEQIRRYNKGGGKLRKPKPFKISKSWEDVAIALKMPETMYKANRKRALKIIQEAYSVAIKLGYLVRVENNGATDILYLNEGYYPKPGELV